MLLQRLFAGALLLLMLALAWKWRGADLARSATEVSATPAAPIKFDNGSVRDTTPTVKVDPKTLPAPVGTLRKCIKGQQVTYTSDFCPAGTQERTLSKGTVNVVSDAAAKARAGQGARHDKAAAEPDLKALMVERALNPTANPPANGQPGGPGR